MGRTSLNPGCRERPLPGFLVGVWALSTGWGWGCQSFTCPLLSALGLLQTPPRAQLPHLACTPVWYL